MYKCLPKTDRLILTLGYILFSAPLLRFSFPFDLSGLIIEQDHFVITPADASQCCKKQHGFGRWRWSCLKLLLTDVATRRQARGSSVSSPGEEPPPWPNTPNESRMHLKLLYIHVALRSSSIFCIVSPKFQGEYYIIYVNFSRRTSLFQNVFSHNSVCCVRIASFYFRKRLKKVGK